MLPVLPGTQCDASRRRPDITSKADLTDLCEIEDIQTGVVTSSTFTFVDASDYVWFGQVPNVRKYDLTVEDLRNYLLEIPDETVYPKVVPSLTLLPDDVQKENLHIKRPKLLCLDSPEETQLLPRMLLEEALTLEHLKSSENKHLVRYHGCLSRRGRIVGIALEKYEQILQYRFEDDPREFDISACINGIRDGIAHLHSLGYAHNDLNPMNIALDKCDQPVVLDFGSCRKFGEQLLSGGTPGWIDEDYSISARQHDESALEKIELWLQQNNSRRTTAVPSLRCESVPLSEKKV